MNNEQITFHTNLIKFNKREIARLEKELENPRIRKPQKRIDTIRNLKVQIDQAEKILAAH